MKINWYLILFASILCNRSFSQTIFGLDPSFGSGGKVFLNPGTGDDYGQEVALQSDGKIILVGSAIISGDKDFVVVRLNTNGSLDATFGGDGIVTTDFNNFDDAAHSVVIQPDGKIVVGGEASTAMGPDFAVARYNIDGSLDNTFSGNGKVTADFDNDWDYGISMALQADGKIVLGGYRYEMTTDYDFALARFTTDGVLDNTFSSDGKTTTDFGFFQDYISEIAIQPDGKIVASGFGISGVTYFEDFCIARYNVSGSLDASFGTGGKVMTEVAAYSDECWAMALQPDGKILIGGFSDTSPDEKMAVLRYNPDGTLDSSFDGDGVALLTLMGLAPAAQRIFVKSDGKILIAGSIYNGSNDDFFLLQLNDDGTPDISFDGDGVYSCSVGTGDDMPLDIDLQPDGKIVLSGFTDSGSDKEMTIARFMYGNVSSEENTSLNFNVYPNPTNGKFNVQFDNYISEGRIKISDLSGKKIFESEALNGSQFEINLENPVSGLCICEIHTEGKVFYQKIILE
ncbi:MAG: T9SS type A sorting domain-containing protein [Crocinitomicaceae bacterium]|nr:T9SS type A sorting domain-containing protein [Crocinitomicaceae bacterium]